MKKNRFSKVLIFLMICSITLNFPRIYKHTIKNNFEKKPLEYYSINSYHHHKKYLSREKIHYNLLKKCKKRNQKRFEENKLLKRKSSEFKKYMKKIKNYND